MFLFIIEMIFEMFELIIVRLPREIEAKQAKTKSLQKMLRIDELKIMTFEVLEYKKVWLLSLKIEFCIIRDSTSSNWIKVASMFEVKLMLFEEK